MARFNKEDEFEKHLRNLITQKICAINPSIIMFDNKNLADIVICKNEGATGIFFIEVKHLKPSMGRLGIGGKNGTGYQPEIVSKRPEYLESNLRWALYSETHENNDGIIFISTEQLCSSYLQGNEVSLKYNGIKQDIFNQEQGLSDDHFIELVRNWIDC